MDEDLLKYKRNLGIIQIALGASLLSFSPVFVNFANVGPAVAGFYRMLFGAVVLLLALIICKVPLWQGRAHFMWAFFCSFLFTLDLVLWHRSIYYIGPGLATLLSSCQIFLLVDFEFFVLKEKIPFQLMLGIILAMVGLYCIVGIDWHTLAPHEKTGVFLGLFTALCYAAYVLILRKIQPGAGELSLKNLATLTLITLLNLGLMGGVALVCKESFMIPDTQSWWVLLG
jgi:drug/metabolite transporter (DMT)-like permease